MYSTANCSYFRCALCRLLVSWSSLSLADLVQISILWTLFLQWVFVEPKEFQTAILDSIRYSCVLVIWLIWRHFWWSFFLCALCRVASPEMPQKRVTRQTCKVPGWRKQKPRTASKRMCLSCMSSKEIKLPSLTRQGRRWRICSDWTGPANQSTLLSGR